MRKQTKLVAVLSAAALLAMGASMTSFAAGWEKDDAGVWHYYDSDDNQVTDEWKKDGGKWFYLNEDGDMETDAWVDDDYYVGEDGAMLVNKWIKVADDDDSSDPDDDGENWYYFNNKGKKVTDDKKKINGKTYYFNTDGEMRYGWFEDNGDWYYLGTEDEGWRTDAKWLWLEEPNEDDEDNDSMPSHDDCSLCDSEGWYYFQNDGKAYRDNSKKKKINGKTYYFNTDGEMRYGWFEDNGDWYYLGTEDEGWRTDAKWLWLEEPNEDDEDNDSMPSHDDCSLCDSEGWYYFQNDGKAYRDNSKKKKINGKYYYFNEHGQMLYEWINTKETTATGSTTDFILDGSDSRPNATASDMIYANEVEDGSRAAGWYEIDGAEDLGNDNDTDWYFFKKGEAKKAGAEDAQTDSTGTTQYRKKIKINGKYFCFDQDGKMQTGLQRIAGHTYYFDDNGYMKTGKTTADDDNDDTFTFYFSTKNNDTGKGYDGIKDGYLYADGQRLEADDDYAVYKYNNLLYVVNKTGKIQKSTSKKYELDGGEGYVTVTKSGTVNKYFVDDEKTTTATTFPTDVIRTGGFDANGQSTTDGFVWEP